MQPVKAVRRAKMSLHRFRVVMAVLASISVCLLMAAAPAIADKGLGAYKMEGAWVAKVVGFPGQWSYVLTPDSSGRRASGHGSVDVGFDPAAVGCDLGESNAASPILSNVKMTGPDTFVVYSVWYGLMGPQTSQREIAYIGEVRSEYNVLAPGKTSGTHYFYFYLPSQDVDPADGFPDEGEAPACFLPFPFYTLDTRVPAP
jgi:hypothetical protein